MGCLLWVDCYFRIAWVCLLFRSLHIRLYSFSWVFGYGCYCLVVGCYVYGLLFDCCVGGVWYTLPFVCGAVKRCLRLVVGVGWLMVTLFR